MTTIHINRDRQPLGQFSEEEVSAGLASGRFLPTDLGWSPGMESWKSLSEFQDLPAVTQQVLPPPIPTQEAQVASSSAPFFEPPWERREQIGVSRGLLQTIKDILTKPAEVFSKMRTEGDFVSPLLYAIILTTLVGALTLPYTSLYTNTLKKMAERLPNAQEYPSHLLNMQPLDWSSVAMAIVLMPILATVGSFLFAGVLHLILYLTGGARKGFESTFRVACYSDATTVIFRLIPFVGILIATILNLWLLIVGLKEVNRIEGWRAAIAVLFLPILFFICMAAAVASGGLSHMARIGF